MTQTTYRQLRHHGAVTALGQDLELGFSSSLSREYLVIVSQHLRPVLMLPQPDDDGPLVVVRVDGAVDVDGVPRPGRDLAGETDPVVSCQVDISELLEILYYNALYCTACTIMYCLQRTERNVGRH